jgi:hypothetical protein
MPAQGRASWLVDRAKLAKLAKLAQGGGLTRRPARPAIRRQLQEPRLPGLLRDVPVVLPIAGPHRRVSVRCLQSGESPNNAAAAYL